MAWAKALVHARISGVLNVFIAAFAAMLPLTNPIGAVAAFATLTASYSTEDKRNQAIRTGVNVFAILVVFALIGGLVLQAFGITLPALQIAGGLVVSHAGFGMLAQQPKTTEAEDEHAEAKEDISFSPMALPLIAGPGTIGVVIALQARFTHPLDRIGLVLATVAIGVMIALILRFGTPLVSKLGPTGIGALTRVMAFLILAIGVELVVHGVHAAGF